MRGAAITLSVAALSCGHATGAADETAPIDATDGVPYDAVPLEGSAGSPATDATSEAEASPGDASDAVSDDSVTCDATPGLEWGPIVPSSLDGARDDFALVWTGSDLFFWGGVQNHFNWFEPKGEGAIFNDAAGTWHAVSMPNFDFTSTQHVGAWMDTTVFVWGSEGTSAEYAPDTDTWVQLSSVEAPSPREGASVTFTGSTAVVWGGDDGSGARADGAQFDPIPGTWSALPLVGNPRPRAGHRAVWTGSRILVWGGYEGATRLTNGDVFDPSNAEWSPMSDNGSPSERIGPSVVWTGTELIVWGGRQPGMKDPLVDGTAYDPTIDEWTPVPVDGARAWIGQIATWTGTEMLVWNGDSEEGALYNPVSHSWKSVTTCRAATPGLDWGDEGAAFWTGAHALVFGSYPPQVARLTGF